MGTTLDEDITAREAQSTDRPVDLAHLARQTMGSRELEREVLHLFLRQTARVMPRFADPSADRVLLAHILLGSARGIGARQVAAAAERLEQVARVNPRAIERELDDLAEAIETTNSFIRTLVAA
ncbi:MAG TPA: Hpt domain-containing protein [Methylomirabilota bacterium]|nr:Hpt domain-containing protein [Methylomirabilota bacterium]